MGNSYEIQMNSYEIHMKFKFNSKFDGNTPTFVCILTTLLLQWQND